LYFCGGCPKSGGGFQPPRSGWKPLPLCAAKSLAEKVLVRAIESICAKLDRVQHSCAIAGRVGNRGFSARFQLMPLLFEQIQKMLA